MLSDAPDYENKKLQLETLYNRLEAAVSPPLIEALTQMDAGELFYHHTVIIYILYIAVFWQYN